MDKSSLESKLKSTKQGKFACITGGVFGSKHILFTGAQFGMEQKFLSLYSSLTEEERFQIGHAQEDLVMKCLNILNIF